MDDYMTKPVKLSALLDIISDKVSQAGSSGASLAGVTSASTSFTVSHR
jgi:hypothetical protein